MSILASEAAGFCAGAANRAGIKGLLAARPGDDLEGFRLARCERYDFTRSRILMGRLTGAKRQHYQKGKCSMNTCVTFHRYFASPRR